MIYGVTINGKHSWSDLKLVLANKEIGAPTVRTNLVNVPGRNGLLDLSEALTGEPTYKNRTIKMSFVTMDSLTDTTWAGLHTQLCSLFHGQTVEIVFDDFPDYKLTGRCTDVALTMKNGKRTIKMTCNCNPFYSKVAETVVTQAITTTDTAITLVNNGRAVVPTISNTAEAVLTWQGASISLSAGTHTVTSIRIPAGSSTLAARTTSGTGTLTVRWNEVTL